MTPEEQKSFEKLFDLFLTEGWHIFIKEIKFQYDSLRNSAVDLEDEKEFFKRKGYIAGLAYVGNFEQIVRNEYQNRIEDEADKDADV